MIDLVVVLIDESSGMIEESVGIGGDDDIFGFILFIGRIREIFVIFMFVDGKRFVSKSSLVYVILIISVCNCVCGI